MSSRLSVLSALLVFLSAISVGAEEGSTPKGVIELFMSQGCASCPAADRAMGFLSAQDDVVALAYHVDYWDYRGWADPLGTTENSARQYGYAHTLGRSGVYTPQAILNGRDQVKGNDVVLLNERLDRMRKQGMGLKVPIRADREGDALTITVGPGSGKADIVVVYFRQRQDMEIPKGANKGIMVSNWNSVTDIQTVGMWDGKETRIVLPSKVMGDKKSDGCAILVQATGPDGAPGAILGATVIPGGKKS